MEQHIVKLAQNAPAATYGGAGATVMFAGMHLSEWCVIISTLVSVAGLMLQVFMALHRIRRVERHQRHTDTVVEAVAESHRALDATKADKIPS